MERLRDELRETHVKLDREHKRSYAFAEELRILKEQNIEVNSKIELEEEAITNKLMKRLSQLKQEKQALANEVEQEEEFLTNTLQKKLQNLVNEKVDLEKQLEAEEEYIVNKLQKQLDELAVERMKLSREKVDLENQLEAEQEYIVNKLQKQVDGLALEKKELNREHEDMRRQVKNMAAEKDRLNKEKATLENTLEAEEENIVNRLQKQIEEMAFHYMVLERKYEALAAGKTSESETSEDEYHGPNPYTRSTSQLLPCQAARFQTARMSLPGKMKFSPKSMPNQIRERSRSLLAERLSRSPNADKFLSSPDARTPLGSTSSVEIASPKSPAVLPSPQ